MKRKKDSHLNLLCDMGELVALLAGSADIASFLQHTVELISEHLHAEVGSIYLYDEGADELVLQATIGLNPQAVGCVRMKVGEGLVGTAMRNAEPVLEGRVSRNPNFKYFEQAGEEPFESFLAVPIQRGVEKIGVMVVQHSMSDYFNETDVMALRATTSQLAGAVENARVLIDLQPPTGVDPPAVKNAGINFVKGTVGSEGFARGPSLVLKADPLLASTGLEGFLTSPESFTAAVAETQAQLKALQQRCTELMPESASLIFSGHAMLLKDPKFIDRIRACITEGTPAPTAVREITREYCRLFLSSPHAYIREKAGDLEDLAGRLLRNLRIGSDVHEHTGSGHVVIAVNLYPSDMLKLVSEQVPGIILVSGGVTSHVSIMSRSLGIPLIIADRPEMPESPPPHSGRPYRYRSAASWRISMQCYRF